MKLIPEKAVLFSVQQSAKWALYTNSAYVLCTEDNYRKLLLNYQDKISTQALYAEGDDDVFPADPGQMISIHALRTEGVDRNHLAGVSGKNIIVALRIEGLGRNLILIV